jgi:hypothetical protein
MPMGETRDEQKQQHAEESQREESISEDGRSE